MTATQTDSLARAIDYLGAVEVARMDPITAQNSDHAQQAAAIRYACKPKWADRWFAFSEIDLRIYSSEPVSEAYWFQAYAKPMPSWWSPEHRFAIRDTNGTLRSSLLMDGTPATFSTMEYAHRSTIYGDRARIITADLTTGAEVPA